MKGSFKGLRVLYGLRSIGLCSSTLVHFFSFWEFPKPNSRNKGTLVVKGLFLGNLDLLPERGVVFQSPAWRMTLNPCPGKKTLNP